MPDTFRHIRRDALMRSALGRVGPVSDLYPPVGEAISLPRCTTLPYRTTPGEFVSITNIFAIQPTAHKPLLWREAASLPYKDGLIFHHPL